MPKENWFNKLFIDEAKPALKRHSGSGGGGGSGIIDCDSLPNSGIDNDSIYRVREIEEILPECEIYVTNGTGNIYDMNSFMQESCGVVVVKYKDDLDRQDSVNVACAYVCLENEEVYVPNGPEFIPLYTAYALPEDSYVGFINDLSELDPDLVSYGVLVKTNASTNAIDRTHIGIPSSNTQIRVSTYDNGKWKRAGTISDLIKSVGCSYLFVNKTTLLSSDVIDLIQYNDTSNVFNMKCMFMDCVRLTAVPLFDTSKVVSMENMFGECLALKEIPHFDTRNVVNMRHMFYNCGSLTTISGLDMRSVGANEALDMFYNCKSLTNLRLQNVRCNLEVCSELTLESLIYLMKELRIPPFYGGMCTLSVGSANLEKLENVYIRLIEVTDEMRAEDDLIDEKYPFEVCERTDEGAVSIIDYVNSKEWNIA